MKPQKDKGIHKDPHLDSSQYNMPGNLTHVPMYLSIYVKVWSLEL